MLSGLTIGNSVDVRTAHNSFTPPNPLLPEERLSKEGSDAFHFISYVHVGGVLWELDGLQPGPIKHAECSHVGWEESGHVGGGGCACGGAECGGGAPAFQGPRGHYTCGL